MFPPEGSSLIRLTQDHVVKPFDCDDDDLNEYLFQDAKIASSELITVTYILENEDHTIAFWSLLNDKVVKKQVSSTMWDAITTLLPDGKQNYSSYPAMKIARLGVSNTFKGKGVGTGILDFLKAKFITNNRTGCKFITVDAYINSVGFYERNGFLHLTEKPNPHTRPMYYDLLPLTKAITSQ